MSIQADRKLHRVVWSMHPNDARDMARFIRENVSSSDLANEEADALDSAAYEVDGAPNYDDPRLQIVVVMKPALQA